MTIARIIAISLAVVALIAGGVTIALAGPGSSSTPITKAQAQAFAQAVNLRASDLPGAKRSRAPSSDRKPSNTKR